MTQQPQETLSRTAALTHIGASVKGQGNHLVFFFDGDFRMQQQLEQRAQLNRAIAAYILREIPH